MQPRNLAKSLFSTRSSPNGTEYARRFLSSHHRNAGPQSSSVKNGMRQPDWTTSLPAITPAPKAGSRVRTYRCADVIRNGLVGKSNGGGVSFSPCLQSWLEFGRCLAPELRYLTRTVAYSMRSGIFPSQRSVSCHLLRRTIPLRQHGRMTRLPNGCGAKKGNRIRFQGICRRWGSL